MTSGAEHDGDAEHGVPREHGADGGAAPRRRVTKGYVVALTGAAVFVAASILVAAWGLLALATGGEPVTSGTVPAPASPVILIFALAVLAWGMWRQAIGLLRGRRGPAWSLIVAHALGGYLIWCLGGTLVGMSISETWLSPYAWLIALAWGIGSILFWAVLARRVYTDRPVPKWPWEKRGEPGPDTSWRDDLGGDR